MRKLALMLPALLLLSPLPGMTKDSSGANLGSADLILASYDSADEALGYRERGDTAFENEDYQTALRWYRKSAALGDEWAQNSLGYMYDEGLGVSVDDTEAVNWYLKAADQGNSDAQFNLALMYDEGEGVEVDDGRAVYWYDKAAQQGDPDAQYNLAIMYDEGEGTLVNDPEAVRWYLAAAAQGYSPAQRNLAIMYMGGEGTKRNYRECYIWATLAAWAGENDDVQEICASRLNARQIGTADEEVQLRAESIY